MPHMFAELVPQGWADRRVLINVYGSTVAALRGYEVFNRIPSVIVSLTGHPFTISTSDLSYRSLIEWPDIYVDFADGKPRLQHRRVITDLLPGKHVFLMAPLEEADENRGEARAKEVIAQAEGMISLLLGDGILSKKVYETISEPGLQANQIFGAPIRGPVDPNCIRLASEASLQKLAECLSVEENAAWKGRVQTALTACSRAQWEYFPAERFFHFWTALEVIFGGYNRVAGYIDKLRKEPKKREGLLRLKLLRRKLVHEGSAVETQRIDEWLLAAVVMEQIYKHYAIRDEELAASLSSFEAGRLDHTHGAGAQA